jgi:DNA-binding transcriptional MerR regulator
MAGAKLATETQPVRDFREEIQCCQRGFLLKYISIGRFSKLTGLSIRALRLYDAEHILEPNWVDPSTGYRYYTNAQLERAQLVRQLRSCEMPLEQIQTVLDDSSRAEEVLLRHRQHLRHRLLEHQEMLRTLDTLLPEKPEFEVKFRFVSDQPVLAVCENLEWHKRHAPGGVSRLMGELYNFVQVNALQTTGAPMLTYPCPDGATTVEVCTCVPIAGYPTLSGRAERRVLPAAELAYTVHRGGYDSLDGTLMQLLRWVLDQKLEIVGDARQVFLEHAMTVNHPRKYRTELAIPIRRPTK